MRQVSVEDSCVGCGSCVEICPEVFELAGEVAVVRENADLSLDSQIIEAAEACPVEAIVYENSN
ncbi:MAG: Ferredoxin-2 [Syntrophorhabdus sp. PtaU1.Bin050]|jgi:ferredoxin|nr:MAG: Ferredoxin-2 [Syntrophorhabdus sp. PtaU1.Bin050]